VSDVKSAEDAVRELSHLREQIEEVDRQVVELIARRAKLAREAGHAKLIAGLPRYDPVREVRVIETAAERAKATGLPEQEVRQIMRQLISIARHAQEQES
jgi:chorismate mutase